MNYIQYMYTTKTVPTRMLYQVSMKLELIFFRKNVGNLINKDLIKECCWTMTQRMLKIVFVF
jgi:hypothetical protein